MQYLLLFPCSSGYTNVPQCYVICTLPVLFYFAACQETAKVNATDESWGTSSCVRGYRTTGAGNWSQEEARIFHKSDRYVTEHYIWNIFEPVLTIFSHSWRKCKDTNHYKKKKGPATDGVLRCTDAEDWVMEFTQQKERQKRMFCCQLILYKIKPIFLRKCLFAASDSDCVLRNAVR